MTCPHAHPADPTPARPAGGVRYWRSLEELTATPEFLERVEREFPRLASELTDPVSRRRFLQLAGATLALAGVVTPGCIRRQENIQPYVVPPEQVVPGKPLFFATAMPRPGGYGIGLLAESHEGRPTKVEGNPDHPASLGATDIFAQASVLSLYDPDRARTITAGNDVRTWTQFVTTLQPVLEKLKATRGAGLHVLTEPFTSPTIAGQFRQLLAAFPEARWHQWDPVQTYVPHAAARQAFGRPVETIYHFDRADRVLSLDADFLSCGPASVRYGRDFARKRRVRPGENATASNRLYAVASTPNNTSAVADERLVVRASQVPALARELFDAIRALSANGSPSDSLPPLLRTAAADLWQHRGRSVVVPGEYQPADVHLLAHAINDLLAAPGQTVTYIEPVHDNPTDPLASLAELTNALRGNSVSVLLILGTNPVYTAPADLGFEEAIKNSRALKIHHSPYADETTYYCDWHIPESHYLESWGDVRAFDGTASVVQPLILPIYESWTASQLLAAFLGTFDADPHELVRAQWRSTYKGNDFERFWLTNLQKGVIPDTASPAVQVRFNSAALASSPPATNNVQQGALELQFRPDPTVYDGRYANNGWLQELPKPLTRLVWDNAAFLSPATAKRLNLADDDVIHLRSGDRTINAPVSILPGHPDDAVTVHLGYGHRHTGRVADGAGFDAYPLRTSANPWHAADLQVTPAGRTYRLVRTQRHFTLHGREEEILHVRPLAAFLAKPAVEEPKRVSLSLYPEWNYTDRYPLQHRWGMSVDLNACTGCQACVVACVAENNTPVVGKDQCSREREMHWLRIDTYYAGDADDPVGPYFQPMLCQQCENAPCEIVCPVEATTHSAEGINEMTYNRCVGTRYCSNNCPYKVRRFNFLQYSDVSPLAELHYNPDVTVRQRGVMEKCTFCVQRLNAARVDIKQLEADALRATSDETRQQIRARMDDRMRTLQTACQQACPTEAIVFGDLNWKYADGSQPRVVPEKELAATFVVLPDLQTQPRVTYLPRLLNPSGGTT